MILCTLIGNPNVGQEVLFNKIAKAEKTSDEDGNSKIEKQEGFIDSNTKIAVFPGIYSMDTGSNLEKIFNNHITNNKVNLIINVVNALNLERNLYLTIQLKKLNIPMVIVLNMVDKAEKNGIHINVEKLSQILDTKIIPMNNIKYKEVKKLKNYIKKKAFNVSKPVSVDTNSEKETYSYIESVVSTCTVRNIKSTAKVSEKIDRFVLNRYLAYPIFIAIIYFIFKLVFSWVGTPLAEVFRSALFNYAIPFLSRILENQSPWFKSLLVDGVVSGISSVLVFLPVILTLFALLSLMEDSGYMSRAALLMDKIMSLGGVSGKSFIPMIIGFGCSVPALMAAKNIENKRERVITALLIPFMSCNAKLPVYMLFATIFFPKKEIIILGMLYFTGISISFFFSLIFKFIFKEKEDEPYMEELPDYIMPDFKLLLMHTWEKGKGFLKKIGTIIFSMSIIIWVLSNFNFNGMVNINYSFLAAVGKFISPIFNPLGFGNWQNSVSLLTGLMGKEVIAGTLGVLYGGNLSLVIPHQFNLASALSFLVFILLYSPCASTIITMKKEFGVKITLLSIFYQFATAWIISFLFFNIGMRYFYGL
ncbi:ferrous iron transport protein B [Clostridium sp. P21]|uniref:Ferrous iron transport protein B n=1 Tax=Clostridium muellerianum TaxID=2716538 RepID=A0A7Y0EGY2_9CLOT|nr:ferrous iron transport protein B [Clostridium muellerianum]NMM63275.1 ferrous iron transport protein B [Clostridium muellerianum]